MPDEKDQIKKALHKVIAKAYFNGRKSVSKEHAVDHIVSSLDNPGSKVPPSHVPATSASVLNKDMKTSMAPAGKAVGEIAQQKQMNAEASLGMPLSQNKMPKKPGAGGAAPMSAPKMPGMAAVPKAAPAGAGAPPSNMKPPKMGSAKPLSNFMQKREMKKSGNMPKSEHQPHPGPSKSPSQKIIDAKEQSAQEAHLKSPKGEAERKAGNAARLKNSYKKPSKLTKEMAPMSPPPAASTGQTINSQIGFPFGKSESKDPAAARDAAEKSRKAAHDKMVDDMNMHQYMTHAHGKHPDEMTAPNTKKHQENLKNYKQAYKAHMEAIKAHKKAADSKMGKN